ncbi:MAG TPA: aspartyl protease family protein [Rhizomicrobium sp.]|jgi:predicted aspartyl protease
MRIGSLVGSLTLAILLQAGAARAEDCGPLKQVASVDMTMTPDGRVLVPVSINGTPQQMMLSTASGITSLTNAAVNTLSLHAIDGSNVKQLDSTGNASQSYVQVDSFAIGAIEAKNIQFMVTPNPGAGNSGSFVGLLAGDLLSRYDVEIDFAARKLNFFLQDHCPGHVLYWNPAVVAEVPITLHVPTPNNSRSGFRPYVQRSIHIWVPVTLDGKPFRAAINTAAHNSSLSAKTARFGFGVTADSPGSTPLASVDGNPDHRAFGHVFSSLTFDGVSVTNPHVVVIPDLLGSKDPDNGYQTDSHIKRVDDDYGAQITVGMDVLKKLRIYIAFGERKLYISPASMPVAAAK